MTNPSPVFTSDSTRVSVSLGTWQGIPVLFHGYFMAVFVVLLIFAASSGDPSKVSIVLLGFAIWVASSILHEVAHLYICQQVGGVCQLLVFSPLGGQSIFTVRGGPARTMLTYIAGPLANLAVALTALVFLVNDAANTSITEMINPFEPRTLTEGSYEIISLKLFFFLNWFIFLTNLLPVFPLDGGYVLSEAIRIEPPTSRGPDLATEFVGRWSVLASAGAFAATFWCFALGPYPHVPTWVVFASLGAYVYFGAREALARCQVSRRRLPQLHSAKLNSAEDPADVESIDADRIDRWLRERQANEEPTGELEEDEDLRVDRALETLLEKGFEGLSEKEQELLRRASQRYRQRLRRTPIEGDKD